MPSNKKLNSIVTELFVRSRKLNIYLVFITQSYFKAPKDVRLNTKHFLLRKFQIKENFNKLHTVIHQILTLKTAKSYSFLVIDANLASDNPSRFRKNLLERI